MLFKELVKIISDNYSEYSRINERLYYDILNCHTKLSENPFQFYGYYTLDEENSNEIIQEYDLSSDSYFVFDETGHNCEWYLHELKTLKEVEEDILHEGGYLNMFCSSYMVIHNNKIIKFKVFEKKSLKSIIEIADFDDIENIHNIFIKWL